MPVEKPVGRVEAPVPGMLKVPLRYVANREDRSPLGVVRKVPSEKPVERVATPVPGILDVPLP